MHSNPLHRMLPLGWLPLTEIERADGFLPVYRRLDQEGYTVIDVETFYLSPGLYWRHGRGGVETLMGIVYALDLIRSSACFARRGSQTSPEVDQVGPCGWLPDRLLSQGPNIDDLVQATTRSSASGFSILSPALPSSGRRADWLATLPQILPLQQRQRLKLLTRAPARLLRVGYRILCDEWSTHGHTRRQTGEALAVIGLAALGLFPRVRCAVCYRLSMPGTTRCAWHSQTKVARVSESASHAQISGESRLADKVMKELRWGRMDFVTDRGEDPYIEEKTVAGILWGLNVDDGPFNLQGLRNGLIAGHFPHVGALLPRNFVELNDGHTCAMLRRAIDPNEWVVSCWYTRVAAAEAWLKVAARLAPGRRHMQPTERNRERVDLARTLLQQGLSKKEVASRLGVSASHLSHLLRRFSEDEKQRKAGQH